MSRALVRDRLGGKDIAFLEMSGAYHHSMAYGSFVRSHTIFRLEQLHWVLMAQRFRNGSGIPRFPIYLFILRCCTILYRDGAFMSPMFALCRAISLTRYHSLSIACPSLTGRTSALSGRAAPLTPPFPVRRLSTESQAPCGLARDHRRSFFIS